MEILHMLFFTAEETSTLFIALYGAILSTITLIVLIYSRYIDRRIRIRVTVSFRIAGPDLTDVIEVRASNIGVRGTSLGTPSLKLPHNRQLFLIHPYTRSAPNPYEFSPGKPDLVVTKKIEGLTSSLKDEGCSGLVPFVAIVPGAGDKRYKSKKMLFDMDSGDLLDNSLRGRLKRIFRRENKSKDDKA
jgi:hypothetical protein